MQYRPTRTGSDGTGYYRGADGNMYYGNPANGYLTETKESAQRRNADSQPAQPSRPSVPLDFSLKRHEMSPWEKALAAGTAGIVILVFAVVAVIAVLFGSVDVWKSSLTKAMDCLSEDGLFLMLRLFWQVWVCLLGALYALKTVFSTRRVPWVMLAAVFGIANLLRQMQAYPDKSFGANLWGGLVQAFLMALPVAVVLWLLSRLLQKLRG